MKFFILVQSRFQSRSLIPNQFNFEGQNHEKNINLKNLPKEKR
jgi:hypothetical protein